MFIFRCRVQDKTTSNRSYLYDKAIWIIQSAHKKVFHYWVNNHGVSKTYLFKKNIRLIKEFKFVDDINSHACKNMVKINYKNDTLF